MGGGFRGARGRGRRRCCGGNSAAGRIDQEPGGLFAQSDGAGEGRAVLDRPGAHEFAPPTAQLSAQCFMRSSLRDPSSNHPPPFALDPSALSNNLRFIRTYRTRLAPVIPLTIFCCVSLPSLQRSRILSCSSFDNTASTIAGGRTKLLIRTSRTKTIGPRVACFSVTPQTRFDCFVEST